MMALIMKSCVAVSQNVKLKLAYHLTVFLPGVYAKEIESMHSKIFALLAHATFHGE